MSRRKLHLEALRMLAIFFVVMNHTGNAGQLYYLQIHDQPVHWLLMGLSALHKTAVPLFLMVSGALLIDREESLRVLLRKRVLRFALVLLLFSLLGYLYDIRFQLSSFNSFYFFSQLYSYRLVDSYWYLYCYLGYLLMLPFLRRLAPAMRDRDFAYLAALWLVFKGADLLPIFVLGESYGLSKTFVLFALEYTFFFPLMGYYLEKRLDSRRFTAKNALLAGLIVLAGDVHALHDDLRVLRVGGEHLALLALVLAGQDNNFIISTNVHLCPPQMTSGARDRIFMNSLSRSSRATGPKMRVPRGFLSSRMMTEAFSSKRT